MDKIKPYLFQLRKHHFWVLTLIVLITGLVGWQMASSDLSKIYAAQKSKIEGSFAKVQAILSENNPPNDTFKLGVDGKTKLLKADVLDAWRVVYNEQRDKVLQWPDHLGEDFLSAMKDIKPDGEIPVDLRELYQNYIDTEFPRLLDIIDAKDGRVEDRARASIDGPRPAGLANARVQVGHDFKVIWNSSNQQNIASRLIFQSTPSTTQVRNTQEDLWVYRALLTIINNVNADATGHHNAKIKVIEDLSIGGQAAEQFLSGVSDGRIYKLEGSRAGGPALNIPGVEISSDPAAPAGDGRYVDEKGRPLPANQTGPPEFKRMPIHLRLIMDQRNVTELLSECANSPLPVEVRQVRLNNNSKGRQAGGGGMPGRLANPLGGLADPQAQREGGEDVNPFDMPVEIHGIIYIFNPPDEKKLGSPPTAGAADPNAAAGGEAPAS